MKEINVKIIPAAMRQFHSWSLLLTISTGIMNLGLVLLSTLSLITAISSVTFGVLNAVMMFLIGSVRFISQSVPWKTEDKLAVIASAAKGEMLPGEKPVVATVEVKEVQANG